MLPQSIFFAFPLNNGSKFSFILPLPHNFCKNLEILSTLM